jgi:beta-glucanase (GH16 family)
MEHINSEMKIHGTAHWENVGHQYWGGVITNDPAIFHEYTIIWDSTKIQWYMDGNIYYQLNIKNNINGTEEFQLPFYMILNLAVGGNWPGYPDQTTIFPAELKIDYVRVYQPDLTNSMDDLNLTSIIYPNPTNDVIYFTPDSQVLRYEIHTLDGRFLESQSKTTPIELIDLKRLSSGSYILTIEQKNKLIRQIIQKN